MTDTLHSPNALHRNLSVSINRRRFLETSALRAGTRQRCLSDGTGAGGRGERLSKPCDHSDLPAIIRAAKPLKDCVVPCSDDETQKAE